MLMDYNKVLMGEKCTTNNRTWRYIKMHDCKNCIYGGKPEQGCSNREENICMKELKVGEKFELKRI